ncbi:hypothetical protein B0T17DRAFT_15584 [Bombardia bombarda]|uniref:Uncharacterized protein n=1 Tax=Bombardia bombarda TaxID=252184 RepID=A0AA39XIV7_9PEZI|nr:hypothetical protein B0T17DRAFT_15584 [Bombardia bombarda]
MYGCNASCRCRCCCLLRGCKLGATRQDALGHRLSLPCLCLCLWFCFGGGKLCASQSSVTHTPVYESPRRETAGSAVFRSSSISSSLVSLRGGAGGRASPDHIWRLPACLFANHLRRHAHALPWLALTSPWLALSLAARLVLLSFSVRVDSSHALSRSSQLAFSKNIAWCAQRIGRGDRATGKTVRAVPGYLAEFHLLDDPFSSVMECFASGVGHGFGCAKLAIGNRRVEKLLGFSAKKGSKQKWRDI